METSALSLGGLLREWRLRRRMSRLDLASDAHMSVKTLRLLETGCCPPTRTMLLHLVGCLDVPLRERNRLMAAGGLAPAFQERSFQEPALDMVRRNVEVMLSALAPNPALAVDRHWMILAANRAVARLFAGAEPTLLRPPVNLLRLSLHPGGLAPRIVNLAEWRAHLIARLRRQIDATGDSILTDLLEELRDYTTTSAVDPPNPEPDEGRVGIPFRLATIDGVLSFFSTTTVFGTPLDITVSGLAIEAFLPADAETADILQHVAQRADGPESDRSGTTAIGL
jgi:transcriptional regulator with XRE-family HTH domain